MATFRSVYQIKCLPGPYHYHLFLANLREQKHIFFIKKVSIDLGELLMEAAEIGKFQQKWLNYQMMPFLLVLFVICLIGGRDHLFISSYVSFVPDRTRRRGDRPRRFGWLLSNHSLRLDHVTFLGPISWLELGMAGRPGQVFPFPLGTGNRRARLRGSEKDWSLL